MDDHDNQDDLAAAMALMQQSGVGSRVGDGFMKKRCHIWRISHRTARHSSLTIVPPSKEQYERLFSTFKETSKLFQEFALAAPLLL
ncbi:hypothetical protein F2Q69_00029244 [Brassica cretica]|uniref:Uncharacterized protein n=1 Tax=Brassica cretica TaxID=69181 RepID=A0A8S9S2Y2_BRACR|nr:hypothetical protein F2Q69_00029244 [Brassica cretica]